MDLKEKFMYWMQKDRSQVRLKYLIILNRASPLVKKNINNINILVALIPFSIWSVSYIILFFCDH